jgi:hypothetical protein
VSGPRGISEERVIKRTGRSSDEWNALLDDWGAPQKGHTASARFLREEHGVSGWWAQTITNRYEWERGLRVEASLPPELQAALDAEPAIRQRFEALSDSRRNEYIRWVAEAKRPDTRARRVAGTLERLRATEP